MKIIRTFFLTLLCLALSACIAGIEDVRPPLVPAVQAPTLVDVGNSLLTGGPYCMNPGEAWSVVLPDCTWTNIEVADRRYSLEILPATAWLAFDEATRTVSATLVPRYTAAIEVTYTCFSASDPAVTDSITFTLNDCDGGGVIDYFEFIHSVIPMIDNVFGYNRINLENIDIYRPSYTAVDGRKKPTFLNPPALFSEDTGMVVTNAADDTADFDGDGISNSQEILNGTNIFVQTAPAAFTFDAYPNTGAAWNLLSVTSGDFNNDGFLDAAVGTNLGISVYLWNSATNTFDASIDTNTPLIIIRSVSVGDFNNDGIMDLAVLGETPLGFVRTLMIYYGDGSGQFPTIQNVAAPLVNPSSVAACELSGDNNIDIAMTDNTTDTLYIYVQNAANVLVLANTYAAGNNPEDIVCADFNYDNRMDIAVVSSASMNINVFLGNGGGSFTLTAQSPIDFSDIEPWAISAADFNNDGFLDIAAMDLNTNLKIFWGEGNGNFAGRSEYVLGHARDFTVADFDGDDDIDIITNTSDIPALTIGINTFKETGVVSFTAVDSPNTGGAPTKVVAADFDGDGRIDVAAGSPALIPFLVLMQ